MKSKKVRNKQKQLWKMNTEHNIETENKHGNNIHQAYLR